MRGPCTLLASIVLVVAAAASCADGDSPGFDNVGGASGEGGAGEGGANEGGTGTTSGQVTSGGAVTSTTATTGGGTTSSSTSSSTASTGTGGEPPCQDVGPGEPANDQMATAHYLGDLSDDDSDEGTIMGTLRTPEDVDWYAYHGVDGVGSTTDPGRQIIGAGIRICKYIDCDGEEDEDFDCPSGTAPDTQSGHPGCCWTGGEAIEWGLTCGSSSLNSDNAVVYMRVDHVGGPGCEPYTLKYNY